MKAVQTERVDVRQEQRCQIAALKRVSGHFSASAVGPEKLDGGVAVLRAELVEE